MGRRRKDEGQYLSDYWKPPSDTHLEGGVGEPCACLGTTFEFDAGFFEAELLPRFLGLRFDHTENERTFILEREDALAKTRAAVLVDISKFDPGQTTLQWEQLPIQVPGGIQHAKLTLLVWQRLIRLIVASANLTRQGYRRNREVFAALDFFDGADSVPLKPLGHVLDFTENLSTWSRALPAATERVRGTVDLVRSQMRGWLNAPQDFTPRERPRVSLIVGHPHSEEVAARSVLDQLLGLWLPRRVVRLTVMTPFVGQAEQGKDPVVSRVWSLPMARDAEGWLVTPEEPAAEGSDHRIVRLPERFGQDWKRRFGRGDRAYVLPVPRYVEGVDDGNRDLHAKAVLFQGDQHELLMIGSSNFTPHGMGVGVFNCEANLAFEDWAKAKQEGLALADRLGLPVRRESALGVDEVVWQQPVELPDDAPSGKPLLPAFFAWACYSQVTGEIKVGLDRDQWEPPQWTVSLAGQSVEQAPPLFTRAAAPAEASTLCFTLDEKARGAHLVALHVDWEDKDGARHDSFLAMSVEDREADLLPPEEFRNLTVDSIIERLLSGRDPAEWLERQGTRRQRTPSTDAAIESLRAVDTSTYLLYRVRRFGRALAAMAERLGRTAPTSDAIRYRLLRDPLGPVHLAEALCGEEDGRNDEATPLELAYRLYVLAEMVLCLGHIGRQVRRAVGRDGKWLIPLFQEAGKKLHAVVQRLRERAGTTPEGLRSYLEAAFAENVQLLGAREEG